MQHRRAAPAAVVVGTLVGGALPAAPPAPDDGPPPADSLVRIDGSESNVWPYTSRHRSVEGRTLAITVVVKGDAERVRAALVTRSDADWSAVAGDAAVGESPWRPARSAARFSYAAGDDPAAGHWIESAY